MCFGIIILTMLTMLTMPCGQRLILLTVLSWCHEGVDHLEAGQGAYNPLQDLEDSHPWPEAQIGPEKVERCEEVEPVHDCPLHLHRLGEAQGEDGLVGPEGSHQGRKNMKWMERKGIYLKKSLWISGKIEKVIVLKDNGKLLGSLTCKVWEMYPILSSLTPPLK